MYLQREAPEWQRFWGTEPPVEPTPEPTDGLAEILDTAQALAAAGGTGTGPAVATELDAMVTLLESHVALLTPGQTSQGTAADPAAGPDAEASSAPEAELPSPADFAATLADFGVKLIDAAADAPTQDYRALTGAGMEQVLSARSLARSAGSQAKADSLTLPYADAELPASPGFTVPGCAITGSDADSESGTTAGAAVAAAADAAYRLAYAYDVSAARLSGDARAGAWKLEAEKLNLARELESTLDCPAIREPAYQLPKNFMAGPLKASSTGLDQLALLLRDAAATTTGESRAWLGKAAWDAALEARQNTGTIPALTTLD